MTADPPAVCSSVACDRPADGGWLCRPCTADLDDHLGGAGWLLDQLNIVTAGLTQYANPYEMPGRPTDCGLPLNLTASDCTADLVIVLQTWTSRLQREHPGWRPPGHTVTAHAEWLRARVDHVRNHADGAQLADELARITDRATRLVDRPPERWYAGVCSAPTDDGDCAQDLYAATSAGLVPCPRCKTVHDIAKRRAVLLHAAEDVLATASEAARAIVVWSDYERGETRLVRRISAWADRRRIAVRGHRSERGRQRPVYRIGDILDLLAGDTHESNTNGRPPKRAPVVA